MKLAPGTPLSISLAFDPTRPRLPVGRLAIDAGLAQLEWSREVIARKLMVAGLLYPPDVGLQAARGRAFEGLHGFLADSLPEGWGYLLMRKRLAKLGLDIASLTPLERLALIGDHGRGALVFEPSTTPPEDVETLDFDVLAEQATVLLTGEEARLADTLAGLAGGSGGARPKVHVGFDGQGGVSVGEVTGLGEKHSYTPKQVSAVIDEVRAAVADWPMFVKRSGVTAASAQAIGQAHARVWADFEPR